MPQPPPSDIETHALEAAVLARVRDERGAVAWLKSRGRVARLAMVLGLFVLEALFFWVFLKRKDFHALPPSRMVLMYGGSALVFFGAAWLALRPLYLPEARGERMVLVVLGLALPVVLALLPEIVNGRPPASLEQHVGGAYLCLANGVVVGGLVFALARLLDRGRLGMLPSALAGGMAGFFMLSLHCSNMFPVHLFLGHATVPAALLLAAYLASRLRRTA